MSVDVNDNDWLKYLAFDFPDVQTVSEFEQRFDVPTEGEPREERLRELAAYPWAAVTPAPIRALLQPFMGPTLADVLKVSFGGDRSAAGRYAAEQRWKGHVKRDDREGRRRGSGVDVVALQRRAKELAERASANDVARMMGGKVYVDSGGDVNDRVSAEGMALSAEIERLGRDVLTLAEAEAEKEVGAAAMAEYRTLRAEGDAAADRIRALVARARSGQLKASDLWDDELFGARVAESVRDFGGKLGEQAVRDMATDSLPTINEAFDVLRKAERVLAVVDFRVAELHRSVPSAERLAALERQARDLDAAYQNGEPGNRSAAWEKASDAWAAVRVAKQEREQSGLIELEQQQDAVRYEALRAGRAAMDALASSDIMVALQYLRTGRRDAVFMTDDEIPQPKVSAVQEVIGRKALAIARSISPQGKSVALRVEAERLYDEDADEVAAEIIRDVGAELPASLIQRMNVRGALRASANPATSDNSAHYDPDKHSIVMSVAQARRYLGESTVGQFETSDQWGVMSRQAMRWVGYHETVHAIAHTIPVAALVENAVAQRRGTGVAQAVTESDGVDTMMVGGMYVRDRWHDGYSGRLYETGARETLSTGMEYLMGVGRSRDAQVVDDDLAAATLGAIIVGGA